MDNSLQVELVVLALLRKGRRLREGYRADGAVEGLSGEQPAAAGIGVSDAAAMACLLARVAAERALAPVTLQHFLLQGALADKGTANLDGLSRRDEGSFLGDEFCLR